MKIVDNQGAREIDRVAQEEYGIPGEILMENAGIRLFDTLVSELRPERDTGMVFIVGGGNNAGDALVMARQAFVQGFRNLSVVRVRNEPRGLAGTWLTVVRKLGIPVFSFTDEYETSIERISGAGIVVDGITGTGLSGPLRGSAAECVAAVASLDIRKRIVAVDAPSGIGDDFQKEYPVLSAALTLTVYPSKSSLFNPAARVHCGRIVAVPIGFPPQAVDAVAGWVLMDSAETRSRITPFSSDVYKNSRGHTALYAGSAGTLGAALLAAEAAGRGGAGLVTLFCDPDVYTAAASQLRSVMARPWQGDVVPDTAKHQSCVIGPGWGIEGRQEAFQKLLASYERGVIDADGLSLLSSTEKPLHGEWVLTPHPGECARLLGCSTEEVIRNPFGAVEKASRKYNSVVLLKGHVSCVWAPDGRVALIDGMNPLMGTGGSGDILCGFIGGLMADAGIDPFDAAATGCCLHQQAGKTAANEGGVFLAEDLLITLSRLTGELRYERA
ncbi:NAD(P)H-hydrate dehydratase [Marispirochaeta sp.]|uniref:NAD(P)H-hydrate dehydratase n=1 Tax=Marispirochaeta sp. TaxID=2038653 RepID=UPI0029C7AC58|nr:NAD(P)H-hydrate dehydratase [Marispirochaeta sp.]